MATEAINFARAFSNARTPEERAAVTSNLGFFSLLVSAFKQFRNAGQTSTLWAKRDYSFRQSMRSIAPQVIEVCDLIAAKPKERKAEDRKRLGLLTYLAVNVLVASLRHWALSVIRCVEEEDRRSRARSEFIMSQSGVKDDIARSQEQLTRGEFRLASDLKKKGV